MTTDQMSLSRRHLLRQTGAGFGALALTGLLNRPGRVMANHRDASAPPLTAVPPHFPAKAKRVIHLFMNGGPSQIDTFDPKPEVNKLDNQELPESFKNQLQRTQRNRVGKLFGSPFKFEKRGESGLDVSELYPHVAQHTDDLCVIRSMQGEIANHGPGLLLTNCGHSTLARPSVGAWLLYGLGNESDELPGFVVLCPRGMPTSQSRNWTSSFLPGIYQGTHIDIQGRENELIPNLTRNDIRPGAQRAQVSLTQFMNRRHALHRQGDERLESRIHSMELAFRMQSAATDVFDLEQETEQTQKMYGDTVQGKNLLIARRLSERGVRYVQIYHGGGQPWDSHGSVVKNHKRLTQESDQPIAALLTDLKQRGLLDETLVIWGGEMGRTATTQAKVKNRANWGRDHHIDGYTIWMAGGGIKGGMTYGATDELGQKVAEKPVTLHDLHATILHQMGFDHKQLTYNYSGRDFRLTDVHGKVIQDILS